MSFKSDKEAHIHYAALVQSSSEAIISFTKDLNGTILTWNKGAEKAYGYLANEVIGCNIAILLPPDYPNDIPDILEQIKRGESIENYETVRLTKSGAHLKVALNVSPIRSAEGSIIGASSIARDITELKRAEEALRESERRFSAFMLNLPAAAWIKDLKGRYVYVNAEAESEFLVLAPIADKAIAANANSRICILLRQ